MTESAAYRKHLNRMCDCGHILKKHQIAAPPADSSCTAKGCLCEHFAQSSETRREVHPAQYLSNELCWFHVGNGLKIARFDDSGRVAIVQFDGKIGLAQWGVIIDADTWASLVASVRAKGEQVTHS